ncbi:MAG: hypothetical protein KAH04_07975, partial [Psychrilyobacter sp.]|nr:hypothetical protein [Psychrilyobacter sp.]
MKDKYFLKKIAFPLTSLIIMLSSFLILYFISFIKYKIELIKVLKIDGTRFLFAERMILFSNWWILIYFTFLLFYLFIYLSYTPKKSSINFNFLIITTIFFSLLSIPLKEVVLQQFEFKKIAYEYKYKHAKNYHNRGIICFQNKLKKTEIGQLTQWEKGELNNVFKLGCENFKNYLIMDPIYSIDKQTLLSNRKTGKQIEENKRNLENEVAALEMLRFMTAHRKKLVNSLHEKTVEATNSNIKIKYNEIEKATILLNGGLKEKDIRKIVSAYEIYVKNNQNDSNDLEFIQGMDISYGELVNLSFFRDEVEPLFQIPVTEDLLILQKFENENKYEKIIASKLVISRGKVYLKDINIKGFNIKDDKYLYQIKSSYGVIEKNRL